MKHPMIPEVHIDHFGRPLVIGATVLFASQGDRGKLAEFEDGTVEGYTKQQVYVRHSKPKWRWQEEPTRKRPESLVIFEEGKVSL